MKQSNNDPATSTHHQDESIMIVSHTKEQDSTPLTPATSTVNDDKIVVQLERATEKWREDSTLTPDSTVPTFSWDSIAVGEKLGEGGFGAVHRVTVPNTEAPSLAIKFLRSSITDMQTKTQGIIDMTLEGNLLSSLQHENLLKMYGKSKEGSTSPFLIMEVLNQTLAEKIQDWKRDETISSRRYRNKNSTQYQQHQRHHLNQRLAVAIEIANVLRYLHSQNVVYRDLKASNIGFDADGKVKLFDFGLAKEMKNPEQNGKYRMTGQTGSWVYMAPEVAKNWSYDASVDIYSFGILLWEICSLQRPYQDQLAQGEDLKSVLKSGDVRPTLDDYKTWPTELKWLLKKCWAYFASHRPSWDCIVETLQDIMDSTEPDPGMIMPTSTNAVQSERTPKSIRSRPRRSRAETNAGIWMRNTTQVSPSNGSPEKVERPRRIRQRSGLTTLFSRK